VLNPYQDMAVWINDGITLALALLFGVAWLALRRDRLELVTAITVAGGGAGTLATVGIACFSQGLSPLSFIQVASLGAVLVLVGMLGDPRTIVGATVALNALTLSILLWAPRAPELDTLIRQQLPLLASVALTFQWMVAVLMIGVWLTYRQTLKALGLAYERAQQLDTLKAQFITHINHELRTPIMTLQGYVEYLRLGRGRLPEKELDDALAKAGRTADTLVALLSSILDVRRIEREDVFPPERVALREALEAALALIDPRVGDGSVRDLRVRLADDLVAWGDPVRMQQILTNLLSNAVKYSPSGTPIEVSGQVVSGPAATGARRRGVPHAAPAMVEIAVRDYGQGIPSEQIPLLFNRFVRLPRDLASKVGGSGLGLYLCRVFAEAMGGTMQVESAGVPGEGSRFVLRLPVPAEAAPASVATPAAPDAQAPTHAEG
jgi:signal transduction histidine kinase